MLHGQIQPILKTILLTGFKTLVGVLDPLLSCYHYLPYIISFILSLKSPPPLNNMIIVVIYSTASRECIAFYYLWQSYAYLSLFSKWDA